MNTINFREYKYSGIYCIFNKVNGKRYIGSSKNISSRLYWHISHLRNNTHHNEHLQRSFFKYGEENFEAIVLEKVIDLNKINDIEQIYVDSLSCCNRKLGYNIQEDVSKRRTLPLETRRKISQAGMGRKNSQESIIKAKETFKKTFPNGFSQEKKDKFRKAQLNRTGMTEELQQKIINLYLSGSRICDIVKVVGRHRLCIANILNIHKIPRREK